MVPSPISCVNVGDSLDLPERQVPHTQTGIIVTSVSEVCRGIDGDNPLRARRPVWHSEAVNRRAQDPAVLSMASLSL